MHVLYAIVLTIESGVKIQTINMKALAKVVNKVYKEKDTRLNKLHNTSYRINSGEIKTPGQDIHNNYVIKHHICGYSIIAIRVHSNCSQLLR